MNANRKRSADTPDPQARQAACDLAIEALGYIAGDPELLARFLAMTGLDPGAIRAAAAEPDFLLGVLEYVCGDERLLVETDAPYLTPQAVRKQRNQPAFVAHTLAFLAAARGQGVAALDGAVERNAARVFGWE